MLLLVSLALILSSPILFTSKNKLHSLLSHPQDPRDSIKLLNEGLVMQNAKHCYLSGDSKLEWEVEQIMGARRFGWSRQLQYQVRWVGYSDAHDTWETADDIHAPQLTADFWKGNQTLARELTYKPPPNNERQTNSLSISLMTTHGTNQNSQHYPHCHCRDFRL